MAVIRPDRFRADPAPARSRYPAGNDAPISDDVLFEGTCVLTLVASIRRGDRTADRGRRWVGAARSRR